MGPPDPHRRRRDGRWGGALALAAAVPGSVPGLIVGAAALVGLVGLAVWLRGGAAGPAQPVP